MQPGLKVGNVQQMLRRLEPRSLDGQAVQRCCADRNRRKDGGPGSARELLKDEEEHVDWLGRNSTRSKRWAMSAT